MADMPDLGKKVGPLPLGAWIAVVAGGLALGYYINKRSAANNQPSDQQLAESGVGTGGGTFLPINPPSDTGDDDAIPDTNQTWANKAITWLTAQNMDALVASSAVNKYINGQTLSVQESALIAMALGHFGPPPEGIGSPPDNPNPTMPTNFHVVSTIGPVVMLAWSPVAGATSYEIRWNSQFGEGGPQTTVLPTLASGGHDGRYDHTFYVRAVNDYGVSDSASVSVPKWSGDTTPPVDNPPPTNTPPNNPPPPATRTYTIQGGDTLTGISVKMYGTSSRWISIYNANAGTIEDAARRHGKASSRGNNGTVGWWIYPGTVLTIP